MEQETTTAEIKYASFGYRMLASVIDNILSVFLLVPLFSVVNKFFPFLAAPAASENPTKEEAIAIMVNSMPSIFFQSTVVAVIVILFWIYKSATPGKMILKMKIVDAKTGAHPTNAQMFLRYLGYFASVIPACLGFVWIYYDKKKQGFHDKIAGTVVIRY
jgi:uncharacterized RDD family membrane protein YckC